MTPEIQSPLERLHRRIIAREKVSAEDVDKAVEEEIKALQEKYKDNPATLANREARIREFHERLKRENEDLYKAYQEGKLEFFTESRKLWEGTPSLDILRERPKRFDEAMREAAAMTDPERDGEGVIADYEGWGPGWVSDTTNSDNETRWTLSGYMTAMGLDSPQTREKAYSASYDVYDSWTGSVLKYDELREDLQMGKYLDDLRKYSDMEDEPRGYLAGALALSETYYPQTDSAYRKYLFETVDKLAAEGKFKVSEDKNKWERGHDQMNVLKGVYTPREWNETHMDARAAFERLKMGALALADSLGIKIPEDVKKFLEMDVMSILNEDVKKITDYAEMLAAMAKGVIVGKKDELVKKTDEVEKKLNEVIEKNKSKKRYTEESLKAMRERFDKAKAAVAGAAAGAAATLEAVMADNATLEGAGNELNSVFGAINSMLAGFETAAAGGGAGAGTGAGTGSGGAGGPGGGSEAPPTSVDTYKDKWSSAELVDGRWTVADVRVAPGLTDTPYRDSNGNIKGKIPGGTNLRILDTTAKCRKVEGVTFVQVEYNGQQVWVDEAVLVLGEASDESKEARERTAFLQQKDLVEQKGQNKYIYHLNSPGVGRVNGKTQFIIKNPDVKRIFGDKFNAYMDSIFNRAVRSEELSRLRFSRTDTLEAVASKMESVFQSEEFQKIGEPINIAEEAYAESTMEFSGANPPSLAALRESYDKKFIPAWERAAARLDKLTNPNRETAEETPPEGTRFATKIDPEIVKILGGIEAAHKYADVSHKINLYMKNPEKYPQGIMVHLPFNNTLEPARIYYANGIKGGQAFISFQSNPPLRYRYGSMENLVRRLHQGHVLSRRQYSILGSESSYKRYENYIGELDSLEKIGTYGQSARKWTHKLEFDWPGRDPDIWVRPEKHGRIVYAIDRNNAAPDGSDVRKGYCENFNAFLVAMKRYLSWTERYDDIPDSQKPLEASKERLYDKIIHPRAFRQFSNKIGRVVELKTRLTGVDMVLDWGGGNDLNSRRNAKLRVWINSSGEYSYSISREDIKNGSVSGTSPNIRGIVDAVERIKKGL